jgi:hypothetical protein
LLSLTKVLLLAQLPAVGYQNHNSTVDAVMMLQQLAWQAGVPNFKC